MDRKLGKALKESNGYTVCAVFVVDENGEYIEVGFAVLDPNGKLLASFANRKDAYDALAKYSKQMPDPPDPPSGFSNPSPN